MTRTALPEEAEIAMDRAALVAVRGELDLATAEPLRAHLAEIVAAGFTDVQLDASDLTFCDSSGLAALIGTAQRLRESGGALAITGARPQFRRLVQISELAEVLELRPSGRHGAC